MPVQDINRKYIMYKLLFKLIPFLIVTAASAEGYVELPGYLAEENAVVENLKDGLGHCEGPAIDSNGNLLFVEGNKIWKITPEGESGVFLESSTPFGALAFDHQGNLTASQKGRIALIHSSGEEVVLCQSHGSIQLEFANDLSIASNGDIYFTDPEGGGKVYFCRENGDLMEVAAGLKYPNGIMFIDERQELYIATSQDNTVWKYDVNPDGSIENPRAFAEGISIADGMAVDELDNFYVASFSDRSIYVLDSTGMSLGIIFVDEVQVSNCAFGSRQNMNLYITHNGGASRVQLKVAGRTYKELVTSLRGNRSLFHNAANDGSLPGHCFNPLQAPLAVTLGSVPYSISRLALYDLKHKRIPCRFEITAHQDGVTLEWNGRNARDRLLPVGPYVLVAEQNHSVIETVKIILTKH
jgi:gluconolactonase